MMVARTVTSLVVASVAVVVMAAAGCGGGDSEGDAPQSTTAADTSSSGTSAAPEAPPAAASAQSAESADCAGIDPDTFLNWGYANQILIQVRDQSTLDTLRDGVLVQYSPDEYADTVAKLHALLDGKPAEIYEDPKQALDYFGDLNERLRAMLAVDGPVPQATFDEYTAAVGEIGEAVGRQLPIGASLAATCPDLAAQLGG
jgi:hypothetical protein